MPCLAHALRMHGMTTPTVSAEPLSDEKFAEVWKRRCEQLNWAHITYRYHRKRQRFFDVVDKLTQVAAVGGGVAVAGKTVPDYLPAVGGAIAFTGLLALVFGYGDKRQCHKELAELAIQMAGDIEGLPVPDLTEARVCAWEKTRTTISLREPASLKTLVAKCEWEQAVAEGHPNHCEQPGFFRQLHMHFF
ncbi:hypothetical protein [Acidovorax sp.]|uniref:hypothetical protein n=1 Tax=Acidovorax sp. TaxID=1872122 RepID=UPI0031E3D0FA